jgi:hypothetical protein
VRAWFPIKNNHVAVMCSVACVSGRCLGGVARCSNGIICFRTVYANVHHLASVSRHQESDCDTGKPPTRTFTPPSRPVAALLGFWILTDSMIVGEVPVVYTPSLRVSFGVRRMRHGGWGLMQTSPQHYTVTPLLWVRSPNERNQGKQAHPALKYRVPPVTLQTSFLCMRLLASQHRKFSSNARHPNPG